MGLANHLIVLTDHHDHLVENFFFTQAEFLRTNFTTLFVESVPSHLKGQDVIDYLLNINVTYIVKIDALSNLKDITPADIRFMGTAYVPGEDKMKFLNERLRILNLAFMQIPLALHAQLDHANMFLTNFKRIKFFEKMLALGMELSGCEPSDYVPGLGVHTMYKRDQSYWELLMKYANKGKRVFVNLGAHHGIGLYEACKANPHQDYVSFVRLVVNKHVFETQSAFSQWVSQQPIAERQLPNVSFTLLNVLDEKELAARNKLFIEAASVNIYANKDAKVQYQQGLHLFKQKLYPAACDHLLYAATLFEGKTEDSKDLAVCYSTIASCYRDMGDLGNAKVACELALELCTQKNLPSATREPIQTKLNGIVEKMGAAAKKPSESLAN